MRPFQYLLLAIAIFICIHVSSAEQSSVTTADSTLTTEQPSVFLEQSQQLTSDSDSDSEADDELNDEMDIESDSDADSEDEGENEFEHEHEHEHEVDSEHEHEHEFEVSTDSEGAFIDTTIPSRHPQRQRTPLVQSRIDAAKLHFKSSSLAQETAFVQAKVEVGKRKRRGGKRRGGKKKKPRAAQDVEDCVACRYIWLQVEMDVGNSQLEENIYDSFTQNCIEAQKAPIFYPACQDMFDAVDDMIGDYMDGYTVNQLCENSRLCR